MTFEDRKNIPVNSNLALLEKRGFERVFRVLGYKQSHVYLHEIGTLKSHKSGIQSTKIFVPHPAPRGIRSRISWHIGEVEAKVKLGRLYRIEELGIPHQMLSYSAQASEDNDLVVRKKVVAELNEVGGEAMLYDVAVYSRVVQMAVDKFNVSANSVRKWFEAYLFYAKHDNALVDQAWRKGAPGVSRRNLRDAQGKPAVLGRRTDSEILGLKGTRRRRLTPKFLAKYENFLRLEAMENNYNFPYVYRKWQLSQVAFNRDGEGTLCTYAVDPQKLPGDENMRRIGRMLLKKFRHERDVLKYQKPGRNGGSAQDIVNDQLPVLDIDGTLASNFILFGDEKIEISGQGQPTILLAVDRASLAIVGWNVSFGAENGDAYLNCVFSAYTPKIRELHRWEMAHLQGFVHGATSEIFIDRGPGISMRTQESLVDRLRIQGRMAMPGAPTAKGHAEQVMLYAQASLMNMAGSKFKTGNEQEDSWRAKFAKTGAVPLKIYMRALLDAISQRNLETDASHLLTPHMMKHGVLPCPKEIYLFNKAYRRGDAAWDWAPEDIFRRLCVRHELKAPAGVVTLKKRKLSSPELVLFAKAYASMHNNESSTIVVYELPNAPFAMLWELPGHGLGLLKATPSTLKLFEDGPTFFTDFQNKFRNSLFGEARLISLSEAQRACAHMRTQATVSNAVQAKIDAVESSTKLELSSVESGGARRREARRTLEEADLHSRLSLISTASPIHELTESPVPVLELDIIESVSDSQDLLAED